jgi:hypothetical protein
MARTSSKGSFKAFLVGVNDYLPIGPGGPDLRGCVNDVRDVAHTLITLDLLRATPSELRIRTDAKATKDEIIAGLKWLMTGVREGDVRFFYYSGHGSQTVDTNRDELDGRDETLCPSDFRQAGMIRDDDLAGILAATPKGVGVEVVLDCCHSGTGTRDVLEPELAASGPRPAVMTSRYVEPPLDSGLFLDENPSLPVRRILRRHANGRDTAAASGMREVVWAGCRDNQTSEEGPVENTMRGVFTYHFCYVLRRAGIGTSRQRIYNLVAADLKRKGYIQIPQLEGGGVALEQTVFAPPTAAPFRRKA